jgi:hypothetical protein
MKEKPLYQVLGVVWGVRAAAGEHLTAARPHDDRPTRGMKARRALRWRTMVAFHKEFRVSPTITAEITFRNKIS